MLLLRNAITLRSNAAVVSHAELLSLVAAKLLDANADLEVSPAHAFSHRRHTRWSWTLCPRGDCPPHVIVRVYAGCAQGKSEHFRLNAQANIEEAISLLPTLATVRCLLLAQPLRRPCAGAYPTSPGFSPGGQKIFQRRGLGNWITAGAGCERTVQAHPRL